MTIEHDTVPLDGNAAAGLLAELFAIDVTIARVTCRGCGSVSPMAEARIYGGSMGAIFRCVNCDGVVMRLARTPDGYWLDMRGARSLFARAPKE